jgi:putative PIN family toxin of toxin-antitoxin system
MATRAARSVICLTLDSNVYISALEYGGIGARFLAMARLGTFRIDTSQAIITETIGVLRDKYRWDGYRLRFAVIELRKMANVVVPMHTLAVTDDPDDNRILECAVEAGSDFIITYDKDLLRLGEYAGVKILRASEFLQRWMER